MRDRINKTFTLKIIVLALGLFNFVYIFSDSWGMNCFSYRWYVGSWDNTNPPTLFLLGSLLLLFKFRITYILSILLFVFPLVHYFYLASGLELRQIFESIVFAFDQEKQNGLPVIFIFKVYEFQLLLGLGCAVFASILLKRELNFIGNDQ